MKLNFLGRSSKNTQIPNLIEIRPVEAQLFHADRQKDRRRDMRKLILITVQCFQSLLLADKMHLIIQNLEV